jgi:3-hydroxyisobutyrate dehydrogenase-like beta-hydroxyacid dehydrogenase
VDVNRRIGFVGLGSMGAHMARRLLDRGYNLILHDIREEALAPFRQQGGASIASSLADVAANADTVMVSLPSPSAVMAVISADDGLCAATGFDTYIDLSTTGPKVAEEVAAILSARGVVALDAPVSGGVSGAQKGTLAIMVSGPEDTFSRERAALEIIGSKVFYVGPRVGQGQVMKLTNNYLSAVALAASSEAVVMGVKAGLNPSTMVDIFNASSGRNSATQDKFPLAILNRKFNLGFKTGLMYKDVALCMSEADRLGATMWVGNNTKEIWKLAQETLGADSDFTEIVRLFENWSNVIVSAQDAEADL